MSRTVLAARRASAGVAPINTVAPVISGSLTTGATLSCTTGTWTGTPTPTYSYQWLRSGVSIGGATSSTYSLTANDAGRLINCVVTATNASGSDDAVSNDLVGNVYALAGLTNIAYFATAPSTGPVWTATDGTIALIFEKITSGNIVREYRFDRFTSATRGWRSAIYDGTKMRVQLQQVNGTPANTAEVNTVASPAQDQVLILLSTNENGSLLQYLSSGTPLSAAAALASYTAATTEAFKIGETNSSAWTDEINLLGVATTNDRMSAAQVTSYMAQVKAGGSRVLPGSGQYYWDAADVDIGGGTWVDRVSGLSSSKVGAGTTLVSRNHAPVYA